MGEFFEGALQVLAADIIQARATETRAAHGKPECSLWSIVHAVR